MTPYRDTLHRAAALLESSPDAWTKSHFAHDLTGSPVNPKAAQACRWCALGAIIKVSFNADESDTAVDKLQVALGQSVVQWNDKQTDKSVVIAKLREVAQ